MHCQTSTLKKINEKKILETGISKKKNDNKI